MIRCGKMLVLFSLTRLSHHQEHFKFQTTEQYRCCETRAFALWDFRSFPRLMHLILICNLPRDLLCEYHGEWVFDIARVCQNRRSYLTARGDEFHHLNPHQRTRRTLVLKHTISILASVLFLIFPYPQVRIPQLVSLTNIKMPSKKRKGKGGQSESSVSSMQTDVTSYCLDHNAHQPRCRIRRIWERARGRGKVGNGCTCEIPDFRWQFMGRYVCGWDQLNHTKNGFVVLCCMLRWTFGGAFGNNTPHCNHSDHEYILRR